jgi:DNA-binding MarR family transcriptional regulator
MLVTRADLKLPAGLTLTQLRALAAAEETGACSLNALAEELGITTSSASRLVDRLVAAGVLDRRTSDINRREVTLRVTTAGRRLLNQHQGARQEIFVDLLRGLTRSEARALLRGLEAVQRYLART